MKTSKEYDAEIVKLAESQLAITKRCRAEKRERTPEEQAEWDEVLARIAALEESRDEAVEDEKKEEELEQKSRQLKTGTRRSSVAWDGVAPAVQVRGGRSQKYSVLRALDKVARGEKVDGLEGELSREIEKRFGRAPEGFYLPTNPAEFRDLDTSTGTGSIFVAPVLPFIELLRKKMVTDKLGITRFDNMDGKFSIPRQSGAATAYWVTEGNAPTVSNQTIDQVAFVNKTLGAYTDVTRKFLSQTSIDAEKFVYDDLAAVLALELDRVVINGSGSGAEPQGILQNSSVSTVALTNDSGIGANPTFADMVKFETTIATNNADLGNMAYLTSAAARGYLKGAQKATNYPEYIWEKDNTINGYAAMASNQVPSNLTKSSGTGLSAAIFGNWSDAVLATFFGGVDVLVNPYSNSTSGTVRIVTLLEADFNLRHTESFAKSTAVKTS